MEPVLYCITLGAQEWRAHPAVLFSLALQEVFSILSSFILLLEHIFSFACNILYPQIHRQNSICAII
jgi:hypothetical protein